VQNIFGVSKVAALLVLIGVGLTVAASSFAIAANRGDVWEGLFGTAAFAKTQTEVGGPALLAGLMVVGGALVGSLFAADAWANVTFTAAEVQEPHRNLPLSMVLGVGLVIALYLLANLAYLASLPVKGNERLAADLKKQASQVSRMEEGEARTKARRLLEKRYGEATLELGIAHARDDRVGTAVLELAWPKVGTGIMAIAILISTFGCINGLLLMGARLYYAMSRDGLFFRSVGQLNSRGVPAVALVLQGAWASVLVFSGTYSDLLDYVIFAALLFYALTVGGLFVLRYKRPHADRPYKAFGYPILPALYVVLCVLVMLDLLIVRPVYTWPGLILVLTGIPVYFLWRLKPVSA
jgi:APA family basic amino acid/polyamine antiporter